MKERYKKIIFTFIIFAIVLIAFVLLESFLWSNRRSRSLVRNDFLLSYTLNPAFQSREIHINQKYARGTDFSTKKDKSYMRIFTLGDSCTFGWHLSDKETYPYLLEKILNKDTGSKKFEVINFGTPGYSSLELLNMLENHIHKLSPDIITVMIGWNDSIPGSLIPYKLRKKRIFFILNSFINKSKIITFLKEGFARPKRKNFQEKLDNSLVSDPIKMEQYINFAFDKYATIDLEKKGRTPINEYETNLKKIINFCKNTNIELFFITSPCGLKKSDFLDNEIKKIPIDYWKDISSPLKDIYKNIIIFDEYIEVMKKVADEFGIPLIDCYGRFLKLPITERLPLFDNILKDWVHTNQKGNYLIAEVISEHLKKSK